MEAAAAKASLSSLTPDPGDLVTMQSWSEDLGQASEGSTWREVAVGGCPGTPLPGPRPTVPRSSPTTQC